MKIVFCVFVYIFSITVCLAKQKSPVEVESFPTKLFAIFTGLNHQIETFFKKEKADQLNRHLNYFRYDLYQYLVVRKRLTDKLNVENYNTDDKNIGNEVQNLKVLLGKLMTRLNDLRPYLTVSDAENALSLINSVDETFTSQRQGFVTRLDYFFRGKYQDIKLLKADGEKIYKHLNDSVNLIAKIQSDLQKKFNL